MRERSHSNIYISSRYHRGKAHCAPPLVFLLYLLGRGAMPRLLQKLLDKVTNRHVWRDCRCNLTGPLRMYRLPVHRRIQFCPAFRGGKNSRGLGISGFSSSSGCQASPVRQFPPEGHCTIRRRPYTETTRLRFALHGEQRRRLLDSGLCNPITPVPLGFIEGIIGTLDQVQLLLTVAVLDHTG